MITTELIKLSVSRKAARQELETPTSLKKAICLDIAWRILVSLARSSVERGVDAVDAVDAVDGAS